MKYARAFLMMTTAPLAAQTFTLDGGIRVEFVTMERLDFNNGDPSQVRVMFTPGFDPEPFWTAPPDRSDRCDGRSV